MQLYSGHEEENTPHTQGVELILLKEAHNTLIEWEFHGSRIIKASFKSKKKGVKISAVQCYSPIKDSDEDDKDQFCDKLQLIAEKNPGRNLTILMGDQNSKVRMDNTGYEDIMGRHGLTGRKERGWREIFKSMWI
ncbi:unnamed protein product [Schistosoma mattheei]|uniref:Uncharacterized protein n=1 Tax=Schistosoma mattheei TaxID=31246 RepID=A0A183NFI0_9TREM|nr:unnamed protein product [Schistosoma mattheei]